MFTVERVVSRVSSEKVNELSKAVHAQDHLRNVLAEIVRLERVVFHAMEGADWSKAERVGEQILIADILLRHHGNPHGIFNTLRGMEQGGKPWAAAVRDLASYTHAYFTTPLGIVMRRDLFGDDAVFLSPEATQWVRGRSTPRRMAKATPASA